LVKKHFRQNIGRSLKNRALLLTNDLPALFRNHIIQKGRDYEDDKPWGKTGRARHSVRAVHGEPDRVRWQAAARRGLCALPALVANDSILQVNCCLIKLDDGTAFPGFGMADEQPEGLQKDHL